MADDPLSPAQLAQITDAVREAVQEELAAAGLRLDGVDHKDAAREDFRFTRKLRLFVEATASKVGWVVIATFIGGIIWLVTQGLNFWKGH